MPLVIDEFGGDTNGPRPPSWRTSHYSACEPIDRLTIKRIPLFL
jgi:hypothetical protein